MVKFYLPDSFCLRGLNLFQHYRNQLKGFFALLIIMFFSISVFAQTQPSVLQSKLVCNSPDRCTSKDLDVVSLDVVGTPCQPCTPGTTVTFPLKMTIHNGTKSERTSFALYGTLSSGATINGISGSIFVCVGAITVKSDQLLPGETAPGNQTFAVGSITFTCGQDLTLSNNYLAWTDASGTTADRCNTFANATQCTDIAPKCGSKPSITINGPVFAPICAKVDPTCSTSTGSITVTSSTTGLTFSLDGGSFAAYPSGGWTGQTPGNHTVQSKRISDGCTSATTTVNIGAALTTPIAPTLGKVDPTCSVSTGTVTITSSTSNLTFKLDNGNFESYPSGGWTGKAPGQHTVVAKNTDGCISPQATVTIGPALTAPVAPTLAKVDPTCGVSTGTITISSSTTGLTFKLDNGNFESYPSGGWTVSSGQHTVVAKNTDGCSSPQATITISTALTTPDAPTLGKADPTCSISTGKVTISSSTAGLTFKLDNGNFESYPSGGWTVSAGQQHCVVAKNTDGCTSSPACVTIGSSLTTPGTPTLGKVDPTCSVSTGTVTITSSTTGLTFSLDGSLTYVSYPSGGWTGQAPGQHTVVAKNTDGCTSPQATVTIGPALTAPARPVVTLQEATICGSLSAPTITVSCPIAGTYTLTQTGVSGSQTKTYPTDNPVIFTVQAGKSFSITVTNTDGCTSPATNCSNYTTNTCQLSGITSKEVVQPVELVAPRTNVLAAPNPFNDRIRFTLKSNVSGQGTLELFNMLGQKVKTVFQGYVNADQIQTINYSVPWSQRINLIYVFRVGNEQTSGKLIGLK